MIASKIALLGCAATTARSSMIPDANAHLNHLGPYGRWAFVECTEIYRIESDFAAKVADEFNQMIAGITSTAK